MDTHNTLYVPVTQTLPYAKNVARNVYNVSRATTIIPALTPLARCLSILSVQTEGTRMLICLDLRSGTGCSAFSPNTAQYCTHCGRPLRYALMAHDPGTLISNYRISALLGYGSFGAVYQSEDLRHPGFSVALKETLDPASSHTFQQEFAVLNQLKHDNLP